MLAPPMTNLRTPLRAAPLALLPMAFALAGGWIDELTHSGVSNWIGACRAQGISFTLFTFTAELLPTAIIGALAGGLVLQLVGLALLPGRGGARAILAAHAGCALAMLVGLLVCAWLPSIPLMLGVEGVLAAGTALWIGRRGHGCGGATSVVLPKPARPNAY